MKKLTILAIIACVALLFAPAAVIGNPPGPPGGLEVNVVNPVPLPVTGDVNATVTGDVNVGNTPEGPLYVRDVDHPARASVIDGCTIFIANGEETDSCSFNEVELGKRLVVEFISGLVLAPTGRTTHSETLISTTSGFFSNHSLIQTLQRTNVSGADWYVVSQPFRIYIDEENRLSVRVVRNPDTAGEVHGDFWITGHLVDVEE